MNRLRHSIALSQLANPASLMPQLPATSDPPRLRDFFFRIDPRSLGLFRICLALVLIGLWIVRWRWLDVMYTDGGVLPRSTLQQLSPLFFRFTPLAWIGPDWGVRLFFLGALASYVMLLAGYRTRVASVLAWIAFVSISHRNPHILIGADFVLGTMLTWSMLLPLGKRFSLDALRAATRGYVPLKDRYSGGKSKDGKSQDDAWNHEPATPPADAPRSLAAFAIIFNFGLIYLFTGIWKTGDTWWPHGTALYFVLHMEQSLFPFGAMMADAPLWLLRALAYGTLIMEYVALPMFFIPWGQPWLRRIILLFLAGFHVGIALTLDAGVFSYAMLACFPLLLMPRDWDTLARLGRRIVRPITVYYDDNCGVCTACCKKIAAADRLGMISFIGNTQVDKHRHKLSPKLAEKTIIVVDEKTGRQATRSQGFAAIARSLPAPWPLLGVIALPGLHIISNLGYDLIAKNRTRISGWLGLNKCDVPPRGQRAASDESSQQESPAEPLRSLVGRRIGNAVAGIYLIVILAGTYFTNLVPILGIPRHENSALERAGWFIAQGTYATMTEQYWNMFAPNAPTLDVWWVADALTEDGRRIDLLNGRAKPDFLRQPRYWETSFSSVWGNYLRHSAARGLLVPPEMIPDGAPHDAALMRKDICRYMMREYEKEGGSDVLELNLCMVFRHTLAPNHKAKDNVLITSFPVMTYSEAYLSDGDGFVDLVLQQFARTDAPLQLLGNTSILNPAGDLIEAGEVDLLNGFKYAGNWTVWNDDGTRLRQGPFVNGKEHGQWTYWHPGTNGRAISAGVMDHGLKHGEWITNEPERLTIETYEDDQLHGRWEQYLKISYGEEVLKARGQYENGQRSGEWYILADDGRSASKGTYENGQRHGAWAQINLENNQVIRRQTFQHGKIDGPWQQMYEDGTLESEGNFVDGKREGTWTLYEVDGTKKESGPFVNGKKHGEWTQWIIRDITRTVRYENGVLVEN